MTRIAAWALAACVTTGACAAGPVAVTELTAAQIVEKNAAARGGAEAWHKIDAMAWAGHIESAGAPGRNLPFLLEQKRPAKTRFEIMAANQKSVRIFDGVHGWKMRPGSSGRPELQTYTADELSFAREAQVIEGPLLDAAARGVAITMGGIEEVEGRKAYRMNLRPPSGANQRLWVDAETFLELRYEREYRSLAGRPGVVSVVYRNYQTVEGLQIPLVIETGLTLGKATDKLVIDKIALNPQFDERQFARPNVPMARSKTATVDTRGPQAMMPQMARPAQ